MRITFKNIYFLLIIFASLISCKKEEQTLVPVITTNEVSDVSTISAIGKATIVSNGGSAIILSGFCWSIESEPTPIDNKTVDGTLEGSFSSLITGLKMNTTYYVRAYAINSSGTGYGEVVEFKTLDESIVFNPKLNYGEIKDTEGNAYKTIKIGDQIWMAENLKSTKLNDGTPILNISDNHSWSWTTVPGYCNYDNLESNAFLNGRLYNLYAVETGKLAPKGWHIPTTNDIEKLISYLIENGYNFENKIAPQGNGNDAIPNLLGKSLASTNGWDYFEESGTDKTGTIGYKPELNNSSGFTAMPSGMRSSYPSYESKGRYANWWSSSKTDWRSEPISFSLHYDSDALWFLPYESFSPRPNYGLSVRCVKD